MSRVQIARIWIWNCSMPMLVRLNCLFPCTFKVLLKMRQYSTQMLVYVRVWQMCSEWEPNIKYNRTWMSGPSSPNQCGIRYRELEAKPLNGSHSSSLLPRSKYYYSFCLVFSRISYLFSNICPPFMRLLFFHASYICTRELI